MKLYRASRWIKQAVLVALIGMVLGGTYGIAKAHSRVEVGPYVIIVGWLEEPVIVGERNALIFEISQDEVPVTGVEATLNATVMYGGRTFRSNLNPTETDGFYTAELFPTVRGQYEVELVGTIGDQAVDVIVEPEEVLSASRLQFPETQPEPRALQKEIADLEAQVQSSRTLAMVGIGVGLLGMLLALVSLVRGRR